MAEIVGIAAETLALHPMLAKLLGGRGNQLAAKIQGLERFAVRYIRGNMVKSWYADILLQVEDVHAAGGSDRVLLANSMTAKRQAMLVAPVINRRKKALNEKFLHGFPVG